MSMTIKQLADSLGVSKPTVSKAISDLGLQGKLHQVGNRFVLEETEIQAVKSQILQTPKPQESQETQAEKTLISLLESQITILAQQLQVKDNQIAAQQEQIKTLTDSLRDTTAALTAAQALHAGTIQQQLTEQQAGFETQSDAASVPEPEQRSIWQRIFHKS